MSAEQRVMDDKEVDRALTRMAHEILEASKGAAGLSLVGIRSGGVPLAARLGERIAAVEGKKVPQGALDIGLYRDDVARVKPVIGPTDIPFDLQDGTVVLVDDVLYTGRTVRAALDELMDFGRPRRVYLAVLVDRGGRELPIAADFVGKRLEAGSEQNVEVRLREDGAAEDAVVLAPKKKA